MLRNSKSSQFKEKRLNDFLKLVFDFLLSLVAVILLAPLFLILSLLILIDNKGPIFFKQTRVGKDGHPFKIYKFRTMVVDAEKLGKRITVGDDVRITRIGKFLRKYKLDELPQLINVYRGEMSFVGPRPEVPEYTALYKEEQKDVLKVKPGITDYASIKYKNENEILAISINPEKKYIEEVMQDKLRINLEYIHNRSILEDIKIIFLTLSSFYSPRPDHFYQEYDRERES